MTFNSLKKKFVILAILFTPVSMTSCDDTSDVVNTIIELLLSMLGWNPSTENVDEQEDALVYDDDDSSLPSKVDLSSYFPPIGNQGSYGTCVAWSTGYAMKTALDAKTHSYTSTQLSNTAYQCSAVDLWHSIPSSGKSTSCNGSNFEPALQALMDNGCASVAKVPFTNQKMTCDGVSATGGSNKLYGYRVIAYNSEMSSDGSSQGMTVNNFKYYLSQGYPILIGAQLGEKFMEWNSSSVITSDTEDYNGEHAYHAMVVTGYDDSKQAFRVRNSWGADDWGDNGCIWVGYTHFINQFVFGGWIAYNSAADAPSSTSTSAASLKANSLNDVTAHVYSDVENADGTRTLTYNIENTGSSTINASQDWSVVYMIYNAKNLNEKAILFHDAYTDDAKGSAYEGVATDPAENYGTNVNLAAGESVAKNLGGNKMQFTYSLPTTINGKKLNGNYYMILIANPFNTFSEKDFANNYCFVTGRNAIPLTIQDGKIMNMPTSLSDQRDIITPTNNNTYSGGELLQMLAYQNKTGKLKKMVATNANTLRSAKNLKKIVK